MNINPIDQIHNCTANSELRDLWVKNVDDWRDRRNFEDILKAKDLMKTRLSWVDTMAGLMADYNAAYDAFSADDCECDIIFQSCEKGNVAQIELVKLVHEIVNNPAKYRIDEKGLSILKVYHDWYGNKEQIKFGV